MLSDGTGRYFALLRTSHYVKNFFIFAPLFFAGQVFSLPQLVNTLIAFLAFSLVSSSVYIVNDVFDIEDDRRHPLKKNRPLASGAVSRRTALLLAAALGMAGTGLSLLTGTAMISFLILYVVLNILYSSVFKHVAILDVCIVAAGFVVRLFVGAEVAYVPLSVWMIVMTFLLALLVALAKRRDDILIYEATGEKTRRVVEGYNLRMLDFSIVIMSSVIMVSYIMYTVSPEVIARIGSGKVYYTFVFVLLGIMRFLQRAFVMNDTGSPVDIVFRDRFLQWTIAGWLVSFAVLLYLK